MVYTTAEIQQIAARDCNIARRITSHQVTSCPLISGGIYTGEVNAALQREGEDSLSVWTMHVSARCHGMGSMRDAHAA